MICLDGSIYSLVVVPAPPKSPARTSQFRQPFQLALPLQALPVKIILFLFFRNHASVRLSRLVRGTLRPIVTKREAGCDGRFGLSKTKASTSGRQRRVVLIPRRWDQVSESHFAGDGG
jgi:hypothetical protein